MKIDPSTTSTALDYGENPHKRHNDQEHDSKKSDQEYQPILPHDEDNPEAGRRLSSRKTRKKRKRKEARKISERRAKQQDEDKE